MMTMHELDDTLLAAQNAVQRRDKDQAQCLLQLALSECNRRKERMRVARILAALSYLRRLQ